MSDEVALLVQVYGLDSSLGVASLVSAVSALVGAGNVDGANALVAEFLGALGV